MKICVQDMKLMIHCDIESLIQLRDNMRNNTKDFTCWINQIKTLKNDKSKTIKSYQDILSKGQKYEITREYQELRSIVHDAEKFELYLSEIFDNLTRPCLSKKELDALCTKVNDLKLSNWASVYSSGSSEKFSELFTFSSLDIVLKDTCKLNQVYHLVFLIIRPVWSSK